ncbi:MAG: c-type cytochrome biogenesis protein CcsB [Candidatus Cloacimonetes bacterium]|nr:c-type cytochrome biogenesis protein CcsB [Candidatus Cloacimonadota bacterium]
MSRLLSFLLILLAFGTSVPAMAQTLDPGPAASLTVLEGGRFKPLDSFAWESVRSIYGKSHYKDKAGKRWGATELVLSMASQPDLWADAPMVRVDFLELKERLGLPLHEKYFSYNQLRNSEQLSPLVEEARKVSGKPDLATKLTRETEMLYGRLGLLDALLSGYGFHIMPDSNGEWLSPMEAPDAARNAWIDGLVAWRDGNPTAFENAFASLRQVQQASGAKLATDTVIQRELLYNKLQPFQTALYLYLSLILVAILASIWKIAPIRWLGMVLLLAGLAFHSTGLVLITLITGRAPVSNLFESMVFISWTMILFTTLFYFFSRRENYLVLIAGVLGGLSMFYALDSTIDISINPLVPVLRSYWLNIHVTIITASYGAFALAAGLGHVYLYRYRSNPRDTTFLNKVDMLNLRSVQLGTVLLTAGVILGAVWANESWGRYWGWDPKETWSLITLLLYLAVIHGRLNGWADRVKTAVFTVAGFAAVLMTYFGVNYYLTGLHSYATGNPDPVPLKLLVYLALETAFVVWCLRMGKAQLKAA